MSERYLICPPITVIVSFFQILYFLFNIHLYSRKFPNFQENTEGISILSGIPLIFFLVIGRGDKGGGDKIFLKIFRERDAAEREGEERIPHFAHKNGNQFAHSAERYSICPLSRTVLNLPTHQNGTQFAHTSERYSICPLIRTVFNLPTYQNGIQFVQ